MQHVESRQFQLNSGQFPDPDSTNGYPTTFISNAHYNAFGMSTSQTLGNGKTESWTYDDRGRVASYGLPGLYSYSVSYFPNGNVMSSNDSTNGDWVYGYDDFNRLTSSSVSGMFDRGPQSYTYVYDRFGNRWQQNVTSGSGDMSNLSFDANNHIISAVLYDAAGNVTNDGTNTYTYDAEGRIATVPSQGVTYVYDAEGRRTMVISANTSKCYVYDLEAHVIGVAVCWQGRDHSEAYVAGRHIFTYSAYSSFNHADWLGTEHYRSTPSGTSYEYCINNPFGDNLACPAVQSYDYSDTHFAGKERDWWLEIGPTNLDNFGARYYSSAMARFMSPDWAAKPTAVPYANYGNPQSLNLYSYVENNPTTTADLDGHGQCTGGGSTTAEGQGLGATCDAGQNQQANATGVQSQAQQKKTTVVQKVKHFAATHPKTVKGAIITLQVLTVASAFFDEGASAAALPEEEGLEGEATAIENITEGGSVNNIKADLSPEEFGKNLEDSGYTRSTTSDGHVQYTNGEKTYTIYQSSGGVPSAQVKVGSQVVSKIRLNPE